MSTRIQATALGIGVNKQTDIATLAGAPGWIKLRKLDTGLYISDYLTEDDAPEIGKGNEFISQVFPVAYEYQGDMQKYGSAEWMLFAWCYALGNVTYGSSTYTAVPIDPGTTLELPYFPMALILNEGGSAAIDTLHYGNVITDVTTTFEYGVGRRTVMTTARFAGSGKQTIPSGVTIPGTPQAEYHALSSSMSITVNGVDYVSNKNMVRGSLGWNNNPMLDQGFYPGSGIQNNASIRGRIEIGSRVPTFTFEARLANNSAELTKLLAQTTGTATVTLTYDATHYITWTWQEVSFKSVRYGDVGGLATVQVVVAPRYNASTGILTVSGKCSLVGLAGAV